MAGIGFRLQKILKGESYSSLFKAYLYSAVISSGPMLVIILSLILIKSSIQYRLGYDDGALIMGIIIYVYAYSMLLAGPFFYIVTRYLADQYYLKKTDVFTPTFISVIEVLFALESLVALVYLHYLDISLSLKFFSYSLFLFVGGIWIAMIFLSAARSYHWIVWAFGGGGGLGIIASLLLGQHYGISGYLAGFTLGEGVIFLVLTLRIFSEFGYQRSRDYAFFRYFRKHPYLGMIGLFYYLGTWADKFVFWYSREGDAIIPALRVSFNYDTPMFFAFITTVPSMAFFLIQMETSFVKHYRAYYQGIQKRITLKETKILKDRLLDNLTENLQRFVLFQGLISGAIIIFIMSIAEFFYLSPSQLGILRIGILGAFLQVGFLFIITVFFYFDFQKEVCLVSFCFLITNFLLSLLSLSWGLPGHGFGYAISCFISVTVAIFILEHKLRHLEYWTFMRQPITLPQFKFESES